MFESVEKPKRRLWGLWPDIDDVEDARAASRMAMWASFLVAGVTVVVAIAGALGLGLSALADAAIFLALGFGISRVSRVAASLAFALFIVERVVLFSQTGNTGGILGIVLLLCFGNGLRGTFAFHRLKKAAAMSDGARQSPPAA